jgi:acyl-CoA thioesterase-2
VTAPRSFGAACAGDLAAVLDLERLDRDLFRGVNAITARERPALFGGQVAAQALMAAGLTVPEGRLPHSLHGYFLRPGLTDRPVILQVARDRDGRSFSARHVAAVQDGEVIFSMLASFHAGQEAGRLDQVDRRDVPPPEVCEPLENGLLLEIRQVTRTEVVDGRQLYSDCLWVRPTGSLPADPLTHAGALTYMSDLGTGFGRVADAMLGTGGPSLDHALWFHEPIPADQWVLLHMWPAKAISARGVYHGAMRDADGHLGVLVAQEHLLRPSRAVLRRDGR